ncbi:phosphorylase family protein [Sorangium sp. So ce542]|uniref:5'-methylthioadenosine/S-adenosylhomocysteine nucleosidase family protein n=1 Tax=Sorangium sp. So ce542 TaxID=3133316 RepID=UPI003F5EFF46
MYVGEIKGRVDFGIITIREDEFEAVLARFDKVGVVEARRRYRIRRLPLDGGDAYTIAVVRCAEQGTSDALNTARDILEDLDPAFLLVVGIAGGVPAYEFTLGDAIVCTRVADFSVEAVLNDHSREYALSGGPLHPVAAKLAADVRAMVRDDELADWNAPTSIGMDRPPVMMEEGCFYGDDAWKKDVRDKLEHHFGGKAARSPLVVTGPVASSDRLIKEAETLQVWLKIARQIQAVEMESAGVYRAAHGRVPFLAIRGISDVVGFKRHQNWTTYACHSAAAFTRAFLLTRPIAPRANPPFQCVGPVKVDESHRHPAPARRLQKPETHVAIPCKYVGGDPRFDVQGTGRVTVEPDGITVQLHDQTLYWSTDSIFSVTYERQRLGMERAEYEENAPINPGEWLIRHAAFLGVTDAEDVLPNGFQVCISFHNEYFAKLFVKRCHEIGRCASRSISPRIYAASSLPEMPPYRDASGFLSAVGVVQVVLTHNRDEEKLVADPMLIYENRFQKTWLVIAKSKIACVLDDLTKPAPYDPLKWQESVEDALPVRLERYERASGFIHFGSRHRRWLYSYHLHHDPSALKSRLEALLKRTG